MSTTGLEVFDTTLQKTSMWLNGLMERMGWDDRHKAYVLLRAVLHALRDRLVPEQAVSLGAQLPMLVRGFYYEGWHLAGKPLKYRHKEEFLERVAKEAVGIPREDLEGAVSAVFDLLSTALTAGEVKHVRDQLPEDIRSLWP